MISFSRATTYLEQSQFDMYFSHYLFQGCNFIDCILSSSCLVSDSFYFWVGRGLSTFRCLQHSFASFALWCLVCTTACHHSANVEETIMRRSPARHFQRVETSANVGGRKTWNSTQRRLSRDRNKKYDKPNIISNHLSTHSRC